MESVKQVLDKLETKDFNSLMGLAEGEWLDVKDRPYVLETPRQKGEFAKDVSALANTSGGIILIGFNTARHPTTAAELISEVCAFPLAMANPDQYLQMLHALIHPPIQVSVLHFEISGQAGKGVAAIVVEPSAAVA